MRLQAKLSSKIRDFSWDFVFVPGSPIPGGLYKKISVGQELFASTLDQERIHKTGAPRLFRVAASLFLCMSRWLNLVDSEAKTGTLIIQYVL
jgi:hypothetical protein